MNSSLEYTTDLLLIGRAGNGKSSTGNSILGRRVFPSKPSVTSVTKKIHTEYSQINGRILKVVDGPGVFDTDLSQEQALELVIQAMKSAIVANPRGYHGILLVTKYSHRFTEEEKQAVKVLKGIFGPDFVAKFTILVLTHGDLLDPEEDNVKTFEDWCCRQTGVFKDLLKECNNRVALFDNRTQDLVKINQQREHLLSMVDKLGNRYTDDNFRKAAQEHHRLSDEVRVPVVPEKTMIEVSLIFQQLETIKLEDPERQLGMLNQLKGRAEHVLENLTETDALENALLTFRNIITLIDEFINNANKVVELNRTQEMFKNEIEKLKRETDTPNQAEIQIAQLKGRLKESTEMCKHLQEQLSKKDDKVGSECRVIATQQNERLFSMLNKIIDIALPKLLEYYIKN